MRAAAVNWTSSPITSAAELRSKAPNSMLKPEDFAWSLGGLTAARKGGSPRDAEKGQAPLGGALFPEAQKDSLDRHLDNSYLKASLAVHALVSVNLGFRALDPDLKQLVPTYGGVLFVQLSAGMYTICTVLLLGLSLGALLDPSILTLSRWDWHSYVIWSFYVFTEVLLFLSRLMSRWNYLASAQRLQQRSPASTPSIGSTATVF